jgi:hypothetical protein
VLRDLSDDNVRGETGAEDETDDAANAVLGGAGENARVERMIVQRSRIEERYFIVLFVRVYMRDGAYCSQLFTVEREDTNGCEKKLMLVYSR